VGFSADHFDGLQGQAYNSSQTTLLPFTCVSSPTNTSFSGCTAHVWNYNPQASLAYTLRESATLYLTFADRGRFPMLKDIYSSGLGSGLPNPDLQPEHSRNWTAGVSLPLPMSSRFQVEWFRSDLRDAIESVYATDPGGASTSTAFCPASRVVGFCSQMVNIGDEVHQGVEVRVRTSPLPRLTLDGQYSYLNRTLSYEFAKVPGVSIVNTSIVILPTLPKNKFLATATYRLPRGISAMVTGRYESGLLLQDTTYPTTSPLFQPFAESYGTMDLGAAIPFYRRAVMEMRLRNVFDRNYQYTAGYPEEGRNWLMNLRYRF
jgi:iron complex outermembrane recepter protein